MEKKGEVGGFLSLLLTNMLLFIVTTYATGRGTNGRASDGSSNGGRRRDTRGILCLGGNRRPASFSPPVNFSSIS